MADSIRPTTEYPSKQARDAQGVLLWAWTGISDDGASIFSAPDAETAMRLALGQVYANLMEAKDPNNLDDVADARADVRRAYDEGEILIHPVFEWVPVHPPFKGAFEWPEGEQEDKVEEARRRGRDKGQDAGRSALEAGLTHQDATEPEWLSGKWAGESINELIGDLFWRGEVDDEDELNDAIETAYEEAASEEFWRVLRSRNAS